jgi:hypothetical protein
MSETLPFLPISQDRLQYLLAAMLVYQQYRLKKTPSSEEQQHTLLILAFLIPKLQRGTEPHDGEMPLLLTVDEVRVIKGGLAMILDRLNRKPVSRQITQEITRLKMLQTTIAQSFLTAQD